MAVITIKDSTQVEILSANPHVKSGFGRYLPKAGAQFLASADFVLQFRRDLGQVDNGDRGLALGAAHDFAVNTGGALLNVKPGLRTNIGVFNRTGMPLFDKTFVGPEEKVPAGTAYVSFTLMPTVGVATGASVGQLGFGVKFGAEVEIRCFRPFDLTGPALTLGDACKAVLENFTLPADVDDLAELAASPAGTTASVRAQGQLEVAVTAQLAPSFNPLASTAPIPMVGKVELTTGASISVGVKAAIFGEFQIRARAIGGNRVRLSYHKMAGRQVDIDLAGSAGLGVTVMGRDLLAMMFGGDTTINDATPEQLAKAGITKDQLDRIVEVLNSGLSRKISVELAASFSQLRQNDVAFLYEIDLAALDDVGKQALNKALRGNLTDLNLLEGQPAGHGITVLQSRFDTLRKKTIRWRINLIGIVNVLHMSALARNSSVVHDEVTGDVTMVDRVTVERLGAVTNNRRLRRMLYETGLLSVSYKASGLDINTDMKAAQSFVFFDSHANRQRMTDFLDAVAAVSLMKEADIESTLGAVDDFGPSSLLLESAFDQNACLSLFLDGDAPRTEDHFQRIGRDAMLALVQQRDADAFRRIPLDDSALWARMLEDRNTFKGILPSSILDSPVMLGVIQADFLIITWWAETMAVAAKRLAAMRGILKTADPAKLESNPAFQKARRDLQSAMADALRKNQSEFDDPWGLVALFLAADGTATAAATVMSPQLQLALP